MRWKLKNILGAAVIVLIIIISKIPMPKMLAETASGTQEAKQSSRAECTVTFGMNGGSFKGDYNGFTYNDKTPVLIIDKGKTINIFPDEKYASYPGYKTEQDTWYTDRECLTKFDKESTVSEDMTLYKKWYNVTSDGTATADKGFHISAGGEILYRYDGNEMLVRIPDSVKVIARDAFGDIGEVRGVELPANIVQVEEGAFSGVRDVDVIYVFSAKTEASKKCGKELADTYGQIMNVAQFAPEEIGEITKIGFMSDEAKIEEKPESVEGVSTSSEEPEPPSAEKKEEPESSSAEKKEPESSSAEKKEPESSSATQNETETPKEPSSSPVIEVTPEYTVTFDAGIAGVKGEKRKESDKYTSEAVRIDDKPAEILKKGEYRIERDDGKQESTYTFLGWYKDREFKEEWDFGRDTVERDTTIYARWDLKSRKYYYVTYNTTEGNESAENIPEKQKLYEDEKLVKPSKNPSVKNKSFRGWYTDEKNASTEYKSWGKPVTGDLSLYAHFAEKTNTVVFHMNGGGFTGTYKGTSYTNAASLKTQIAVGKNIASSDFPADGSSSQFKYSNYETDSVWYTDKEGFTAYSPDNAVLNGDLTLYKKWYYTSSGFTTDTSGSILYKYSGSVADVIIPNTVKIIGPDAFSSVGGISSITLPDNISDVKENAFSGVNKASKDILITGKSENAKNMAKGLADKYTRLIYKEGENDKKKESTNTNNSSIVTIVKSGTIKLGAVIEIPKITASQKKTAPAAQSGVSIHLGADGM